MIATVMRLCANLNCSPCRCSTGLVTAVLLLAHASAAIAAGESGITEKAAIAELEAHIKSERYADLYISEAVKKKEKAIYMGWVNSPRFLRREKFIRETGASLETYFALLRFATSEKWQLTEEQGKGRHPKVWSSRGEVSSLLRGRWIYFGNDRTKWGAIWVAMRCTDASLRELAARTLSFNAPSLNKSQQRLLFRQLRKEKHGPARGHLMYALRDAIADDVEIRKFIMEAAFTRDGKQPSSAVVTTLGYFLGAYGHRAKGAEVVYERMIEILSAYPRKGDGDAYNARWFEFLQTIGHGFMGGQVTAEEDELPALAGLGAEATKYPRRPENEHERRFLDLFGKMGTGGLLEIADSVPYIVPFSNSKEGRDVLVQIAKEGTRDGRKDALWALASSDFERGKAGLLRLEKLANQMDPPSDELLKLLKGNADDIKQAKRKAGLIPYKSNETDDDVF